MKKRGLLYIVATPIGHLGDITLRAIETLQSVDKIVVEDTRHSQKLLAHLGIKKPLITLHEHNERDKVLPLLAEVKSGITLALISDAGTPLISDPGYHLVHFAREQDISVVPIPGPCALITALSASGLATDRFIFEGFLPVKSNARAERLQNLVEENRTLIFYEAPHRIRSTLEAMVKAFGANRLAVVARELTKTYESIISASLSELLYQVQEGSIPEKGEMVILVQGAFKEDILASKEISKEAEQIMHILLSELPPKQAASLTSKITGIRKRILYEFAIKL